MSKDQVDEYAETQVLPPAQPPREEPAENDPLALYEEYARTISDAAARAAPRTRRTG